MGSAENRTKNRQTERHIFSLVFVMAARVCRWNFDAVMSLLKMLFCVNNLAKELAHIAPRKITTRLNVLDRDYPFSKEEGEPFLGTAVAGS